MDKNTTDFSIQNNGAMSTEKTNEDHNKQKPDPNQTKHHQIGEEEEKENHERAIEAGIDGPKKKDTQILNEGNVEDNIKDKNSIKPPIDQTNLSDQKEIKHNDSAKIHTNHQRENENREQKHDSMRAEKISQPEDSSTGKL